MFYYYLHYRCHCVRRCCLYDKNRSNVTKNTLIIIVSIRYSGDDATRNVFTTIGST